MFFSMQQDMLNRMKGDTSVYLKRLDIVGFKSFADRVEVEFVPGVTAVVGPNGSGKSNIIDAIRWVLGEQSAKSLRGAKMEDVIFAGSDSRKPLNFAEVTLTLDNEDQFLPLDYQEISVTRRVYRSGDSEYMINKQPCRLKDIVDLFMDSGLGREAFSIISQGKIDEILNSKAEERRAIFEEAAGVLKYKTRKKKAETKLLETEENLNRVNDILHELQNQLEPLKMQASAARDYLQKKEELEAIEVALTVHTIEELHGKWEKLSTSLEENREREIELSAQLQKKEAEIEETRDRIASLDESINDLQEVLLRTSEELEKLEGKREVLKERKKNAKQNKEQLEININIIKKKMAECSERKKLEQERVRELEGEAAALEKELKECERKLELTGENLEEKIESLKGDYIELLNDQASVKNELHYVEKQLEDFERRQKNLDGENEKYLSERKAASDKKKMIEEHLLEVQQQLEKQLAQFRNEQQNLEALKKEFDGKQSDLYKAYQYLQKAKSRKEMLEEMEEDYSGFYQGVKEILKERNRLPGIEGAVAELIQVDKQYETAIETALGGALQHIVVDSEESGRKAIQYLKQHAYGRATFLPLNVIKGKSLSNAQKQAIEKHPAFVGIASQLVRYDGKYAGIIENLLGTVVIAKNLKGANEMAKLVQYRCRFVTLEGDVVNPGGSMTGGALKQKSFSFLGRKSELESLKEKLFQMEEKTSQIEKQVKQLKDEVNVKSELLEAMRRDGEKLRFEEQKLLGDLREIELEEKNVNEKLALYDQNLAQYEAEKENLKKRKRELGQELHKLAEDIAKLDKKISALTEEKNSRHSTREEVNLRMNELKIRLAAKKEQLKSAKERLAQTVRELGENEENLNKQEEELALLSSFMTDNTSGEEYLEGEAKKKQRDKENTIKLISSRREERLQLQTLLEDAEREAKELKRQHKQMADILKDEEVKVNRIDVELENLLDYLREEYLITFEGAKEQFPLTVSPDEARKKVNLIKRSIDELGTVNLGAIDECERITERYEFLLEQKEDLEEAKEKLYNVIDEMDEEMKKRFAETFNGIRSHFEFVFRALFGGGRADLHLTNPDDLLSTGIEIVAQPPGKKLQNLGLLSGGERALTAIALLFSILKVRPVPFCILDEVEAALDEANVQRYSQYLKRFSQETQFIVITHRKGTMEGADVLYGVTMQESGVSKLVSVKLEETKELIEK